MLKWFYRAVDNVLYGEFYASNQTDTGYNRFKVNQAKLNLVVELVKQIILQGFEKVIQDLLQLIYYPMFCAAVGFPSRTAFRCEYL